MRKNSQMKNLQQTDLSCTICNIFIYATKHFNHVILLNKHMLFQIPYKKFKKVFRKKMILFVYAMLLTQKLFISQVFIVQFYQYEVDEFFCFTSITPICLCCFYFLIFFRFDHNLLLQQRRLSIVSRANINTRAIVGRSMY